MSMKTKTPITRLIAQLKEMRDMIGTNTKQDRYARGRVVDCILAANAMLSAERALIMNTYLAGQNSAEEIDGQNEINYFTETFKQ